MDITTRRWKGLEKPALQVGVEAGAESYGKTPTEKEVISTGKKVYMPPLPSTYKETERLEDLNDGMEWVFRYYRRYLNQAKEPPITQGRCDGI